MSSIIVNDFAARKRDFERATDGDDFFDDAVLREPGKPPSPQDRPIELLALALEDIMRPIAPERDLLPGMVPREAYTLIAGALSSYKTTLLLYLLVWRSTGYDFLNLNGDGAGIGMEGIGPSVLIFYEDTFQRVRDKVNRILQSGHEQIVRIHGKQSASEFLARAAKNIRLIHFTGSFRKTLVTRLKGEVVPNEMMIAELLARVRDFSSADVLLAVDPLRLAIVGSQNDDDGADVVVGVLNRIAVELVDGGIVVNSHTTKSGAQESADGYTGKSYGTSGSALYSQHARSNFHIARLKAAEIGKLFDHTDVPQEEHARQPVAVLSHGRLSHGAESRDVYVRMKDGILVPLKTRDRRTSGENMVAHLAVVVATIDRIKADQHRASESMIVQDENLLSATGSTGPKMRAVLGLLDQNGYIEFSGKTKDRDGMVTPKGRAASRTNQNESSDRQW